MRGLTKHSLFAILCCLLSVNSFSQQPQAKTKLVVGVIVDQMRAEYLYRFQDKFSDDGFKRLMNDGFVCRNTHYNYIPTKTAPGHASVYTGTTPKYHGIIANEWYDRTLKKEINNVDDYSTQTIGGEGSSGQRSPHKMLSTTITDELQLSNDGKSKVISISLKDRGAILPGGHMSDGSYWYDAGTGNFITSTYYKEELPVWVEKFNKKGHVKLLLKNGWHTLAPIGSYTESTIDEQAYEKVFHHKNNASFPYEFGELSNKEQYDIFQETPFGNTLVAMMAGEALVSEKLGQGTETDFLAISFSSTDKIGHAFGPNSIEIEDTYLRLDQDIASLLRKLDAQVGKGNYTLFLTADHAATDVPQYLINNKVPAGCHTSFNVCKQIINRRVAEQATSFRCIVSMPCLGLLQKSNHANEPHVLTKNSYPCYSDLFLRHRLLIHLHTVACNQVRGFSMLTFIIASWRFAARTSLSSVDKKTSASALSAQAI